MTFRISSECSKINFCPTWMAAFIDEDMNILHINTLVFNASSANVEYPAVIPNFFCKKWKILVMYWWFVFFVFWNSGLGVAPCTSFPLLLEHFLVDSLENIRYSKLCEEFFSFRKLRATKLVVSSSPELFVSALPLVSLHLKSPLDHFLPWCSAFQSDQKENHWNGCKRTSRNS